MLSGSDAYDGIRVELWFNCEFVHLPMIKTTRYNLAPELAWLTWQEQLLFGMPPDQQPQ